MTLYDYDYELFCSFTASLLLSCLMSMPAIAIAAIAIAGIAAMAF